MVNLEMDKNPLNKKNKRKTRGKISFEEEIVTKEAAKEYISELKPPKPLQESSESQPRKRKKKRDKSVANTEDNATQKPPKKKKKQTTEPPNVDDSSKPESVDEASTPKEPKKESIRSVKKKKYAKVLEEKKLKTDLELQQKALNYLSKWKHSRSDWKFEKLRQIWLQNNLLDSSKIPDEFWNTVVEYFSGAKGQSRQMILDQAVKCVESEEQTSDDDQTEEHKAKVKRARDIVQFLQ